MSGSQPPPLPDDPGVPALHGLFDAERVRDLIRDATGGRPIERLRWRYLAGVPAESYVVRYEATTDLGVVDVAVSARGSAREPFAWADDPRLQALGDPAGLSAMAGEPCVMPVRLTWVPLQRATLRVGAAVVKVYADPIEAITARERMDRVQGVVASAEPRTLDVGRAVVVQSVIEGRTLDRADALPWTPKAVALLRQLHGAPADGLPVLDAGDVLQLAAAPVDLVSFCRPDLGERLALVAALLRTRMPDRTDRVVAHGDFNVGQLITADEQSLAVVDVDTLCVASPSYDLAAYATNVVSGRRDDLEDAMSVLAEVSHHTPVAHDLAWYVAAAVLRRVDRAIRRTKSDWPRRTELLVEAAEAAAARV